MINLTSNARELLTKQQTKRFYTTGEVARYCEVDINTIKRWIRKGILQAFSTPQGHFRVTRNDFIAFLRAHGFPYDPTYFGDGESSVDVLIIDDDPSQIDLLSSLLHSRNQSLRIESSTNGFDGYRRIDKHRPKLVLLDLKLPGMSGLELIRVLQDCDQLAATGIVVISSFLNEDIRCTLTNLGVQRIIPKPPEREQLEEVCQEVFGETPDVIRPI